MANKEKILNQNISWLKKRGHSKWKQVNFNFKLKKWEQYGCVVRALNRGNLDPDSRHRRRNVPSTDHQNNNGSRSNGLKNTLRDMMR